MSQTTTMAKGDIALITVKRRDRSVTTAMKGLASSMQRYDSSRQSGRVICWNEFRATIDGWNTKIAKFL